MTQRRDFNMVRASDLVIPAHVARRRDGTVIDLTGAAIEWRIGPSNRLTTSVLSTIGNGVTVESEVEGTFSRVLVAALSENLDPGLYRQTVKVTETDGSITLVEQGFIEIGRNLP